MLAAAAKPLVPTEALLSVLELLPVVVEVLLSVLELLPVGVEALLAVLELLPVGVEALLAVVILELLPVDSGNCYLLELGLPADLLSTCREDYRPCHGLAKPHPLRGR